MIAIVPLPAAAACRWCSMVLSVHLLTATWPLRAAEYDAQQSTSSTTSEDVRHVVLMLDHAPLHVSFRITLSGQSLSRVREAYIDKLVEALDVDRDGTLTRLEASRSPLLRRPERPGARAFLRSLESKQTVSRRDIAETVQRVAGETVVYRQSDAPSETDQYLFELLDEDGSGIVEAHEIDSAAERLRLRDRDRDECIGFDEIQPMQAEGQPGQLVQLVGQVRSDRPRAIFSDMIRDTSEPLLPRRLLRKYDRNADGKLSAAELGWSRERVAMIDQNGDGQLSAAELHALVDTPVDLEVAVDVAPGDPSRPQLHIIRCAGQPVDQGGRPGVANVSLPGVKLTVSYRHVDPVRSAVDNAMRRFNQLDADGNGYLDKEEVQREVLLERGLFDMIDADSDGKIFGEEMNDYVRLRAAPEATSCRVNIYDMGSGFFQALDHNSDGRISVREMRGLKQSLIAMQRDTQPGVTLEGPTRRFHIEFVRGSFQMFGPAEQLVSQTLSFDTRVPVGPIWFQRMDRNNDGDLTWNEFLGHREDFYRLDADRDHLIDPLEAEKAMSED